MGSDRLDRSAGLNNLSDGEIEDEVMGDVIDAGSGYDMSEGGMRSDTIRGGASVDAFMVMPDSGHDIVLEFETKDAAQGAFDHIAFMDIMADQVSVSDTSTGARIAWDINGDSTSEESVLLQGITLPICASLTSCLIRSQRSSSGLVQSARATSSKDEYRLRAA
jgi:serralysin